MPSDTDHKQRMFSRKRLLVLFFIPILGCLLVASFHRFTSSVIDGQTHDYLNFWQEKSKGGAVDNLVFTEETIAIVRDGAIRAASLNPGSADYQAAIGKVQDWIFTQAQRTGMQFDQVDLQQGLKAYREAIRLRPSWPYVWADFSMAKARAGELDEEFFNAVVRAVHFGRWEPSVMDTITQLGLWYQDWLPTDVKQVTDQNIARYAQAYPHNAMAIARMQDKRDVICPLLEKPERFTRDCPPVGSGQS